MIADKIEQALQDGQDYSYEHRMRTADGRRIWLHVSNSVVHDDAGEPALIRTVSLDITAQKEAEAERERSHSLLQATLDASADAIFVADLAGKATASNRAWSELWQIPQSLIDSVDHKAVLDHVAARIADPDEFRRREAEITGQDRAIATQDFLELVDGRTIEQHTMPQRLDGEIVGRVWSFRDITEKLAAQRALQRVGPAPPRSARRPAPDRSRHRHAGDDHVRERRAPQADRLEPRGGHRQRLVRSLRRQSLRPRRLFPASRDRRDQAALREHDPDPLRRAPRHPLEQHDPARRVGRRRRDRHDRRGRDRAEPGRRPPAQPRAAVPVADRERLGGDHDSLRRRHEPLREPVGGARARPQAGGARRPAELRAAARGGRRPRPEDVRRDRRRRRGGADGVQAAPPRRLLAHGRGDRAPASPGRRVGRRRQLPRRHRRAPAAGAVAALAEARGGWTARGRNRARLQQPADRDRRLQPLSRRRLRRRRPATRGRARDRARLRSRGRADRAAARLQPPSGAPGGGARPGRGRRRAREPALAAPRRGRRAVDRRSSRTAACAPTGDSSSR